MGNSMEETTHSWITISTDWANLCGSILPFGFYLNRLIITTQPYRIRSTTIIYIIIETSRKSKVAIYTPLDHQHHRLFHFNTHICSVVVGVMTCVCVCVCACIWLCIFIFVCICGAPLKPHGTCTVGRTAWCLIWGKSYIFWPTRCFYYYILISSSFWASSHSLLLWFCILNVWAPGDHISETPTKKAENSENPWYTNTCILDTSVAMRLSARISEVLWRVIIFYWNGNIYFYWIEMHERDCVGHV